MFRKPKYIFPFSPNQSTNFDNYKRINKKQVEDTVIKYAKKHEQIVHGSFALKQQLGQFAREPHDIDVMAYKPAYSQDKMEDKLDILAGYDAFAEVTIPIIGTEGEYVYKVVKKVYGPDIDVVDYFKMKKGIKTKTIKGVRYEHWKYAKRVLENIVRNPELRHRHRKAREDLNRILAYEESTRRK